MHEGQVERFESKLPKIGVIRQKPKKKPRSNPSAGDQESRAVKPKTSSRVASARPETSPASRAMASVKKQPESSQPVQDQNVASAGQRAMEQISSVKQQPTKRPSRFKSESFTPTRTV